MYQERKKGWKRLGLLIMGAVFVWGCGTAGSSKVADQSSKNLGPWQARSAPMEYEDYIYDIETTKDTNEIWAVGNEGVILHYDGQGWKAYPNQVKKNLYSLTFNKPDDGWAVGMAGTILHYDGKEWRPSSSPTEMILSHISFSAPDHGYIVGAAGTVLEYDGKQWKERPGPSKRYLYAALATKPEGLWVGGRERQLFHLPPGK